MFFYPSVVSGTGNDGDYGFEQSFNGNDGGGDNKMERVKSAIYALPVGPQYMYYKIKFLLLSL